MKTTIVTMMTALVLSVSSCRVSLGNGFNERIEPSENIVKAKYPQEAFDKIDNHVVGKIQVVQSKDNKSRVTLSAPDNYIELFEFKNKDGELDIQFADRNVNIDADNVTIIIYTPNIREIENSGAADICMDELTTDELEIKNSGVGSITIEGKTDEAEYSCSGVGNIDAKDMKAREVDAHISGVGGIECFASEYIKGDVSGVGGLKYGGNPSKKDLHSGMTGGISEL